MNTKPCMFNSELLVSYTSGNVSTQERGMVERHLANCSVCRKEVMELEQVWWALDVWHEESVCIQPRQNELRARIEASNKPPATLYEGWKKSFRQSLQVARDTFYLKPAMAFGTVVLLSVILAPMAKQVLTPGTKLTINQDTHQNKEENLNRLVSLEKQRQRDFDLALQMDKDENISTIPSWNAGLQNLESVNVGFVPNANVLPAHQINQKVHPSTLYQVSYQEKQRFE